MIKYFIIAMFCIVICTPAYGESNCETEFDYEELIEMQNRYFTSDNEDVRYKVIERLGRIGNKIVIPTILAALNDEDATIRCGAAFAFIDIYAKYPLSDKIALPALMNVMKADNKPLVRGCATYAYCYIGGQSAIPVLLEAMKDRDVEVRRYAINAIDVFFNINDNRLLPALIDALKDPSVRSSAAISLGERGDKAAVPALIGILNDDDANIRSLAAMSLGKLKDKTAVPDLITLLRDNDEGVRRAAAEALGRIGDKRASLCLQNALQDSDWIVRSLAAEALGFIGDKNAAEALLNMAEKISYDYKGTVAQALIRLGDERGSAILDEMIEKKQSQAALAYIELKNNRGVVGLIKIVRNDEKLWGYCSLWRSIKHKSAIPFLIDGLKGDAVDKSINDVLQRLTGEKFEPYPAEWRAWWIMNKARILKEEAEKDKSKGD